MMRLVIKISELLREEKRIERQVENAIVVKLIVQSRCLGHECSRLIGGQSIIL